MPECLVFEEILFPGSGSKRYEAHLQIRMVNGLMGTQALLIL